MLINVFHACCCSSEPNRNGLSSDAFRVLSSWNDTITYCQWEGVSCSRKHPQRVVAIDLPSLGLAGTISPSIGNLTFLKFVNLSDNSLNGEIPPQIGRLHRLRYLGLFSNSLHGAIPINLTHCSELHSLVLISNRLTGRIPLELASMPKLKELFIANNSLTGVIPSALGNLSALTSLSPASNQFEGSIPSELGKLASLKVFQVSQNMLIGTIPPSLFNLSSLSFLSVAANQLHGSPPPDMGIKLPNLQFVSLGDNQFQGPIPASLCNASRVKQMDLSANNFSGYVPANLGRLTDLKLLNLGRNQLEASDVCHWRFLDSLTNSSRLREFALDHNRLRGMLPNSVANLSTQLEQLYLNHNGISGSIPCGVENLINLILPNLGNNLLSGPMPESLTKLRRLQVLALDGGMLRGHIPSSLGNLTHLYLLNLSGNNLEGPIPPSLRNLQNLNLLDLSQNDLSGGIPRALPSLSNQYYTDLSHNFLDGPLPSDVGSLTSLWAFAVSGNKLSGEIPYTLGNCEILEFLALDSNLFHGAIPSSLSSIKGLKMVDLSHNNMSGSIPEILQTLNSLYYMNLFFNHLRGIVPTKGVFRNVTAISLEGNGLCGGIPELHLPACPVGSFEKRKQLSTKLKVVMPIVGAVMCLLLFIFSAFIYHRQKSRKKPSGMPILDDRCPRVSYKELETATEGFSSHNLIGKGRYGSVYKGTLDGGTTFMAVKVLNLQERGASRSFIAECDALRNIRHRTLVKIHTSCSGIDFKGNEFKALVFEFMPNGSLEKRLHPEEVEQHHFNHLSLIQRLNVAVDVADALEYLHHSCQPSIVHCDLKPSNVLLDNDMNAHVADFGLAKFLSEVSNKSLKDSSSSIGIRGSIGYVAPEYGAGGRISTSGDVYSYGILLLELFTGRKPTNDMFKNGLDLHKFVEIGASSDQVMEIIDPQMLLVEEDAAYSNDRRSNHARRIYECLVSVIKVGLSCSSHFPSERTNMIDVAARLHAIRDTYLREMH